MGNRSERRMVQEQAEPKTRSTKAADWSIRNNFSTLKLKPKKNQTPFTRQYLSDGIKNAKVET